MTSQQNPAVALYPTPTCRAQYPQTLPRNNPPTSPRAFPIYAPPAPNCHQCPRSRSNRTTQITYPERNDTPNTPCLPVASCSVSSPCLPSLHHSFIFNPCCCSISTFPFTEQDSPLVTSQARAAPHRPQLYVALPLRSSPHRLCAQCHAPYNCLVEFSVF